MRILKIYEAILFLLMALVADEAFGQQAYPFAIDYYPMIAYDSNKVKHAESINNFDFFNQKWAQLLQQGQGQINIVHIGGSHVQADFFSGRVREHFQNFEGEMNAGRGFVFPYRLAKTNAPDGYYFSYSGSWESCRNVERNKECSFGIGGISAYTIDTTASLTLIMDSDMEHDFSFTQVSIFHSINARSFEIKSCSPWVDSIVTDSFKGLSRVYLNRKVDSLDLYFEKTDTNQYFFQLFGMNVSNDDPGFIYHNIGINGASTSSFLRSKYFKSELEVLQPDLVIFALGINDASGPNFDGVRFVKNYDSLVRWVYEVNPQAAILFVSNTDSYLRRRYLNRNGVEVQQLMYQLAAKHQAAVWDQFEVMGGSNSIVKWQKYHLAQADRVHFTRQGYYLFGDLLFDALVRDFGSHLEKGASKFFTDVVKP